VEKRKERKEKSTNQPFLEPLNTSMSLCMKILPRAEVHISYTTSWIVFQLRHSQAAICIILVSTPKDTQLSGWFVIPSLKGDYESLIAKLRLVFFKRSFSHQLAPWDATMCNCGNICFVVLISKKWSENIKGNFATLKPDDCLARLSDSNSSK
jgi:hypothetical protein